MRVEQCRSVYRRVTTSASGTGCGTVVPAPTEFATIPAAGTVPTTDCSASWARAAALRRPVLAAMKRPKTGTSQIDSARRMAMTTGTRCSAVSKTT